MASVIFMMFVCGFVLVDEVHIHCFVITVWAGVSQCLC